MSGIFGKIHSFETFSALDGPGLRTVVFFQGCPIRCAYCHNPDALDATGGTAYSAEEVARYVLKFRNYFSNGGGVSLSGGEPLFQPAFCLAVLNILKSEGIHTVIETSGCIFCPECLDAADLVILDIKRNDPEDFYALCKAKQDNTIRTLEYLKSTGRPFWTRQVVVPGFNDTESQVEGFARLSRGAQRAELLAYHTMGKEKYLALNLAYALKDVPPLSRERLNELQAVVDSKLKFN